MFTPLARAFGARRLPAARRPVRPRLESLEERLVLSWYGAPPSTLVPPTGAVSVGLNAQGDASGNAAISANENDYYTFVAPAGGPYRISALTPSSNLDTVLGVFSSSGTRLASNDDLSRTNRDSQLTVTLTAGNRYYFGITNYTGTAGGSYTWQVDGPATGPADDSFEENDTLAGAASLGTLTATRTVGGLVMADAADWFSFTTASAGTPAQSVSIGFQNAQGNLALELYNASGQVLGASNTTGNVETVSLNGLGAGTYYVRVYGDQGATNPSYTLTVTPSPAPSSPATSAFDIVIRSTGLTASQQLVFDRAATRWEQIIVGDVPAATYRGNAVDDLLIDAQSVPIDGVNGVLGQAGPDSLRSGSALPIHGTMQFDTADLSSMEANGTLYDVILHEMGHVLGIGTIWQTLGLLAGAGTASPQFTGARATAEYNALFGASAAGVPVEGTPAPAGTRDGHWRESIFGNELMSGYISGTPNPISRVTVASLADLGYTVNMAAADAFTPPYAASAVRTSGMAGGSGTSLVFASESEGLSPSVRRPRASRSISGWVRGSVTPSARGLA
jgi:hypothetical protein